MTTLKSDIIALAQVDYDKVKREMKDLDPIEYVKILMDIGMHTLEIMQGVSAGMKNIK
jgi:hypothetical protein